MPEYRLTPEPGNILDDHDQPKMGATIRVRKLLKLATPPTREELEVMVATFVVLPLLSFSYDREGRHLRSFARVAPFPELEALAYPSREGYVQVGEEGIHKQDLMILKAWCIRHKTTEMMVPT